MALLLLIGVIGWLLFTQGTAPIETVATPEEIVPEEVRMRMAPKPDVAPIWQAKDVAPAVELFEKGSAIAVNLGGTISGRTYDVDLVMRALGVK